MKNKTQATPVANIKILLAEFERLEGERLRHEKLTVSLAGEEQALLESANLDNPADFEKLSQARMRRDLVPRKARELAAAAKTDGEKLKHLCVAVSREHYQTVDSKIDALVAKIEKALAPIFPPAANITEGERVTRRYTFGEEWDVRDAAEALFVRTRNGIILTHQQSDILNLFNPCTSAEPAWLAKKLLGFIAVVEAMNI